jgi:hypothetical protein
MEKEGKGGVFEETITLCQQEFWQFNFVNNNTLIITSTIGDPLLMINECDPFISNHNYAIKNEILITDAFAPVNENIEFEIKSLTDSKLILEVSEILDFLEFRRRFTFSKEN